jgi:hypothetical protein
VRAASPLLLMACFAGAGCDVVYRHGVAMNCDLRGAPLTGGCAEYRLDVRELKAFADDCAADGGQWGRGACPDLYRALGGCENADPQRPWYVVTWFYPVDGMATADDVRAVCDPTSEVFIPRT